MTVALWRIGVEAPAYEAHDFDGLVAEKNGSCWSRIGIPPEYKSTNLLAVAQVGEVPFVGGPGVLPSELRSGDHLAQLLVHSNADATVQR